MMNDDFLASSRPTWKEVWKLRDELEALKAQQLTQARRLTDDEIAVAFGWKPGNGSKLLDLEREIGRAIEEACAAAWGFKIEE